MGRHSRGAGEVPAPLPDPPSRHPYAPRPAEDTRDHPAYRVVDVGESGSDRQALRPVPEFGTSRFSAGDGAGPVEREAPRYGATRADLAPPGYAAPDPAESRLPAPAPPDPRLGGIRAGAAGPDARFGVTRADPAEDRFGADAGERRFGAGDGRFGADVGAPPFGATRAGLAEDRFGADAGERGFGATRTDLAEDRFGADAEERRFGGTRADLAEARFGPDAGERRVGAVDGRFGADAGERRAAEPAEHRFGAGAGESRYGATRADLAESMGSAALAPRPALDPDEVTDTGARRARSAFRLATEADEDEPHDEHDYEHEPSLLLQWGIFVAQTLTGAIAGLGVWLGFYRLWSAWPFYAVPAVGVAAIAMLVLARTLRRRHGHDLDLLTAVVTVGIATVLTVLPAAFTLQNLAR